MLALAPHALASHALALALAPDGMASDICQVERN
jgi:hypothetical protein